MRARFSLLVPLALLLLGCSARERSNPFDPLNPQTGGRPADFVALAGDREVTLSWQPSPGGTLSGFRLYRRAPGETDFSAITGILSPGLGAFRDFPLVNGGDHAYRLYFVFPSGLGHLPAEQVAAPGAALPWLIEYAGSDLIRLTPDNRHVSTRRTGYGRSVDVAANPANGDVWVTDEATGRVIISQGGGGIIVSVPGLPDPRAIAVDPFDATAWVCDMTRGRVYQFQRDGQRNTLSIGPVDQPVDVAVDPREGFVWVCEFGADRVARYDFAQLQWALTVPGPSRVAVDSTTHEGWVTSFEHGTVTRISPLGQALGTFPGFTAPLGVAVDHRRGRIWIADPYADRVTALDRAGREEFRVTGLTDVGELSLDITTGEAWAVLGLTGSVARISPAGAVLRVQGGFRTPFAISVDPGGR